MLGELTLSRARQPGGRRLALLHTWAQYVVAFGVLAGVSVLGAIIASKSFFLGSDSANHYAHVWYISDQLFHHGRLPLHVRGLESGNALAFPYAVAPWLAISPLFAVIGDRAVTLGLLSGFALYGYAATRARPALRDPRLLALIYANTFLIEGLVSFQLAFIWAVVFLFFFVEAVDHGRGYMPQAGRCSASRRIHSRAVRPLCSTQRTWPPSAPDRATAPSLAGRRSLCVLPFALYIRTTPAVGSTQRQQPFGTLKFMARYRGGVIAPPLLVAYTAPLLRSAFLPVFVILAVVHAPIDKKQVNTFGLDRNSHPFYAAFLADPAFDSHLTYRVLSPTTVKMARISCCAGEPSSARSSSTRVSSAGGGIRRISTRASSALSASMSCCSRRTTR